MSVITYPDKQYVPVGERHTLTLHTFGDTLYYGDRDLTTSNYTGTVASGSSVAISTGTWILSAGQTRVEITDDNPTSELDPFAGPAFTDAVRITRLTASSVALDAKVEDDAVARFVVAANGKMSWGGGASALDANLYRAMADTLKTDDGLIVALTFSHLGSEAGFYGAAPVTKPTGVPVTAAGVHAALVSLGLIGA